MLEVEFPDRESVACSVCGALPPGRPAFVVRGFSVVRCPGCGVRRVSPRLKPAALRKVYAADYWKSRDSVEQGYFNYAGDEANIRRTFRRRLAWLGRWQKAPGRWLDVGCAYGFLVAEALAAGWEAEGIEWSEHAVAAAAETIRSRLRVGTLIEKARDFGAWDRITLWDYLEHSPHPRQDLQTVARLLKPGGLASIIIPDAGALLARLLGPDWEEYKKPQEHLYFFTGPQLIRLVRQSGLRVVGRQWAGKYANLDFAFSRFTPDTGWIGLPARLLGRLIRVCHQGNRVVYINPRDKLHLVCRKEPL